MAEQQVFIYTATGWPHCHWAKEFLSQKGITYQEINVTEHPEKVADMLEKLGGSTSTPLIVIGDEVVSGFDPNKLERLLSS